jgi:S1-C subfamily serine protease
VVVQSVEPRSASAYTGVQTGDVILQINNYQISTTSDVRPAVAAGERNGVMRLRGAPRR